MLLPQADPGSFRDPRGRIYLKDGRVFRTVLPPAREDFEFVRDSGLMKQLLEEGQVVSAEPVDAHILGPVAHDACHVVEHPRIPFISYPYEWSFPLLKSAALLHLDIQLTALEADITVSDASAYNIQFLGPKPIFIDTLSFLRYREGEFWVAHRQFCEQFLNPLLLRSLFGVAHNAWYRGSQEGIGTNDLASLLPVRKKLSWNVLTQVVLQASFQKSAQRKDVAEVASATKIRKLPKASYRAMLERLRSWIASLQPADTGATVWGDYADHNSYEKAQADAKATFIAQFVDAVKPLELWDIGCNTGDFSKVSLLAGAERVIGFDFDQAALEKGYARSLKENLNFLPLFLDAANQSPSQGWVQAERKGLAERRSANAMISLAFVHHMAITRNIPLDQLVDWLVGFAEHGLIEFVPKTDPMVQELLRLREDIFSNYTEENFLNLLERKAKIERTEQVTQSGRKLVWFTRGQKTV